MFERYQEVWSGRSFVVRDVGQSAIHVIGLCLCDVTMKRCYCSVCILYERSLDERLRLWKANRNYGEVIRRSLNFVFGRIGIRSQHLYKDLSEKVVMRWIWGYRKGEYEATGKANMRLQERQIWGYRKGKYEATGKVNMRLQERRIWGYRKGEYEATGKTNMRL